MLKLTWINQKKLGITRVDNRPNKRYGARFALYFAHEGPGGNHLDTDWRGGADEHNPVWLGVEGVVESYAPVTKPYRAQVVGLYAYYSAREDKSSYTVEVMLRASKPSLIPSAEVCHTFAKEAAAEVAATLEPFIVAAVAAATEREHRKRVADQATQLAQHIARLAEDKAKEVTRYKQRLAGLVAETKAELELQVQQMVATFTDDLAEWDNAGEWLPAAVEVAKRKARDYADISVGFRVPRVSRITPEEAAQILDDLAAEEGEEE